MKNHNQPIILRFTGNSPQKSGIRNKDISQLDMQNLSRLFYQKSADLYRLADEFHSNAEAYSQTQDHNDKALSYAISDCRQLCAIYKKPLIINKTADASSELEKRIYAAYHSSQILHASLTALLSNHPMGFTQYEEYKPAIKPLLEQAVMMQSLCNDLYELRLQATKLEREGQKLSVFPSQDSPPQPVRPHAKRIEQNRRLIIPIRE